MSIARNSILGVILVSSLAIASVDAPATPSNDQAAHSGYEALANSIFYQEGKLVENMHKYSPLVETYI